FLLLFLVLSLTSEPFATKTNLLLILQQQSAALIIAAAITLVLVSGGIDLSVGAVWGFAGVTAAHFALETDPAIGMLLGIGAGGPLHVRGGGQCPGGPAGRRSRGHGSHLRLRGQRDGGGTRRCSRCVERALGVGADHRQRQPHLPRPRRGRHRRNEHPRR